MKKTKFISILCAVLAMALLFVACTPADSGPAATQPEAQPPAAQGQELEAQDPPPPPTPGTETPATQEVPQREMQLIRLAIAPTPATAQIFTEELHGLFASEGIYFELTHFQTMAPAVAAMIAGDIDVVFMGLGVHPMAWRGEFDLLFMHGQAISDIVIGNAALGVTDISSLQGHTIALPMGSTAEMIMNHVIQEAGYDPANFDIVHMDVAGAVSAMIAGHVGAVALWHPFGNEIINHLGDDAVVLARGGDFRDVVPSIGSYGTQRHFIEENPELLEGFIRAFAQASQWVNENRDATVELLVRLTDFDEESVILTLDHLIFFGPEEMIDRLRTGRTQALYIQINQKMYEAGIVDFVADPADYLNTELAMRALAAW